MDNQESVPSRSVTFTIGNKGGQQCHLEGYIYTYEKTSKNGNRQWRCKDMKGFTPTCKGRITTCGELATRSSPHCHPSSDIEVQVQTFLSSVTNDEPRTNNFSEGSNYSLNVAVACNNPSPARLVDSLVAFNSETELVILQGMTGMEQKRKILKRYRDLNQRLKSSVQAYHNVPMAFYCRSIGHLNSA